MSGIASLLCSAAELAEGTVVRLQHAGMGGRPLPDRTVIAGLAIVAERLRLAASHVTDPPPFGRRMVASAYWMLAVQTITCVAVLWAVPDPSRPWVLAGTLAGSDLVALAVVYSAYALYDRGQARRLTSAGEDANPVAELRERIAAVTRLLEPDRDDRHLEIGKLLEQALTWLDITEANQPPT
ncbi:MAG TPA: hypothetical protein VF062_05370 [Candidatus Limnocylindrales bacterium]